MDLVKETRIEGEFTGWDGTKRYTLLDGTAWEEVRHKYEYRYPYRPTCKLWRDGVTRYLEVQGKEDKIEVRSV